MERIYNFNPGPATLPLPVLKTAQESLVNFDNLGMSILEISHRSKQFQTILAQAEEGFRNLMGLSDDYAVLFVQGGASTQFSMVPINLLGSGESADYINTGTWSTKAITEAQKVGTVNLAGSSKDKNFNYIPKGKELTLYPKASYLHITSNNTIAGTQYNSFPETHGVPIVCDMSSDILSSKIDVTPFGLIYAGAQKNVGSAGVTVVIIRKDLLGKAPSTAPSMMNYEIHAKKGSAFNTPPVFSIFTVKLVVDWLMENGGIEQMEAKNNQKAKLIYDTIDKDDYYRGAADKDSRSKMNVTFRLPSEQLEQKFFEEASKQGFGGLKGHRSVGGMRASIYNAMPIEGVKALTEFMEYFKAQKG